MRFANRLPLTILLALLLSSCTHPISKAERQRVDQKTTLATVSDNPTAFLDRHLILGGVVLTIDSAEQGSMLEMMEWRLNPWGEPTYLDDAGRRFLVKSAERLDPTAFEPGTLVTLAGVVLGQEARLSGEHEYDYPVLGLTEIHLWESPFRYGIHSNPDPAYPYYVDQGEDARDNPYDPGYNPYPYTQHWYRNPGY